MSSLLEQLNAEQERLEKEEKNSINIKLETMQAQLEKDCVSKEEIMTLFLWKEAIRLKDMHDFINSNPTLKGNMKELTFQRYLEIYRTNHKNELEVKFDHDSDPTTVDVTLNELLTNYMDWTHPKEDL